MPQKIEFLEDGLSAVYGFARSEIKTRAEYLRARQIGRRWDRLGRSRYCPQTAFPPHSASLFWALQSLPADPLAAPLADRLARWSANRELPY